MGEIEIDHLLPECSWDRLQRSSPRPLKGKANRRWMEGTPEQIRPQKKWLLKELMKLTCWTMIAFSFIRDWSCQTRANGFYHSNRVPPEESRNYSDLYRLQGAGQTPAGSVQLGNPRWCGQCVRCWVYGSLQVELRRAPSQRCLESFGPGRPSCATHLRSPVR